MALVSPGLEISVTDESQYVPGAVGTVPLIVMATAQDKTNPSGATATDTTAARAGRLLAFSSQRELISAMGYPSFKQSAAGTPLHGDERNEYGLMAAYSALGNVNRIYAIRADIDLNALEGTSVRPTGSVGNGEHWLDLAEATWGINEWDAVNSAFTLKAPLLITDNTNDTTLIGNINTPKTSIGQIGQYAVAWTGTNAHLFYKAGSNLRTDNANYNTWVRLGTTSWQTAWPAVKGTASNPTAPVNGTSYTITINTQTVDFQNTSVTRSLDYIVNAINTAAITGVTAANVSGKIYLYASNLAESDGSIADGKIAISSNLSGVPLTLLGITSGTYANPILTYGDFAAIPSWRSTDTVPRPSGSVFAKVGSTGSGADLVVKRYSSSTDTWTTVAAPFYNRAEDAIYGLDSSGGGNGISAGTVWVAYDPLRTNTGGYKVFRRRTAGQTVVAGSAVGANPFTTSDELIIGVTEIGSADINEYTVVLTGTSRATFVSDILAKNIPELNISVSTSGVITFTHIYGGDIYLTDGVGTPTADAGFSDATVDGSTGILQYGATLALTNWEIPNLSSFILYYSTTEPYDPPEDGTLWYYSDPASVDILINEIGGWRAYHSSYYDGTTTDARGYDLSATDTNGIIISASEPTKQSDGVTSLVPGDLWLDTGDLENYPAIYRYDDNDNWILIDNTDQVSQNGILFADARWDTDGTTDIITGSLPAITDLLESDYLDQDAPDYRLYPRGMLLFNTRRSGYNVKQFISNKFNANAYPDLPAVPGADSSLPIIKDTWQTASGLKDNGSPYMGRQAQRALIVKALRSAIDTNSDIREEQNQFQLMACPQYPELAPNMVALNNERGNTGFAIVDTPLRLTPDEVVTWATNNNGLGLVTGDGRLTGDSYAAAFYPSCQTTDLSGNLAVTAPSHMMIRTIIRLSLIHI